MSEHYTREHYDIISIVSRMMRTAKKIESDIRKFSKPNIYFFHDIAFAIGTLGNQVDKTFNFHDSLWGNVSYNEIWEMCLPSLKDRLEQKTTSVVYNPVITECPVFIFASCHEIVWKGGIANLHWLTNQILLKMIDLLHSLNKHPVIFFQRPTAFSKSDGYEKSGDLLSQLLDTRVSLVINDLPFANEVPKEKSWCELFEENESSIFQSFDALDKLMEFCFYEPGSTKDLLSFLHQQEILFLGFAIAPTIYDIKQAFELAKSQLATKLNHYPKAVIESYKIVIGYSSLNPKSYLTQNSNIFLDVFSKPYTNIIIKNEYVTGEQVSIQLLAKVSTLLNGIPKNQSNQTVTT